MSQLPRTRRFRSGPGLIGVILTAAALACGGETDPPTGPTPTPPPPTPPPSALVVSTNTTGSDLDSDGYTFSVDGGAAQPIGANDSKTLVLASAGTKSVMLAGVASNCTVAGNNPRQTDVVAATQGNVVFAISCSGPASITVTTTTTGPAIDLDGYTVTVGGALPVQIGLTESKTFTVNAPGAYNVQLGGLAPGCAVTGGNPKSVQVAYGTAAPVAFAVSCVVGLSGKIAFQSDRTGDWDVWLMNPDGNGVANLTKSPHFADYEPAFSRDGTRIAFVSDRAAPNALTYESDVYVMNADGTGIKRLTTASGEDGLPAWSPDGKKIAYGSWRTGDEDVWVMNADGTGQTNLTSHPADDFHHSWSPDGSKIAFSSDRQSQYGYDIWVMNVDGSNPVNITKNAASFDARPSWSPDGTRIAFTSNRDGNMEIYVMNADGSNQARITNHPAIDSYAAWSPDGQYLLFRSDRTGNAEVTRVKLDGSGLANLTNHAKFDCHPSWSISSGSAMMAWVSTGNAPTVARIASGPVRSASAQLSAERASCIGK